MGWGREESEVYVSVKKVKVDGEEKEWLEPSARDVHNAIGGYRSLDP